VETENSSAPGTGTDRRVVPVHQNNRQRIPSKRLVLFADERIHIYRVVDSSLVVHPEANPNSCR
jgi:hypothetical protein